MSDDSTIQDELQEPARPPAGPVDKKKVGLVALGSVIAMLVAVELLGHLTKPSHPESSPPASKRTVKPSPASKESIGNFERQTQQEALDLARLQAQKEALDKSLATLSESSILSQPVADGTTAPAVLAALRQQQAALQQQQLATYTPPTAANNGGDAVRQEIVEQKRRELASLRASNVALDLRTSKSTTAGLFEKRNSDPAEQVLQTQLLSPAPSTPALKNPADEVDSDAEGSNTFAFNSSNGKLYRLFEGRIIETVLTNRINGALSGPIDCMVTTDIYSHDHQNLLIPQGSRIIGRVSAVNSGTQQRLFVAFHRIIMPDGYSVHLDRFAGLNVVGETGLRDIVNRHYFQIFGASLALAAIGGVAQVGSAYGGIGYDPMVAVRAGISRSMGESAHRVLDHFLNQLPTFIVRERARVKIYLSGDLLLPAYASHTMPSDL